MADAQKLAKALQSTISNQPRSNRMLGMIADALKPVQQYASKVNIPIVDENLADFTGLTGTQSLAEDMSYGKPLFSGGSLQTSQIDPRAMDVAGFAPTAGAAIKPVAKSYGKMLAKELGRQINEGTALGKAIDPRMMAISPEEKTFFENVTKNFIQENHPLALNENGNIVLYHGTSTKNADSIKKTGEFKGYSFFTPDYDIAEKYSRQAGKNPTVLKVEISPDSVLPTGGYLSSRTNKLKLDENGIYRAVDE